jgi:hypothetical protein
VPLTVSVLSPGPPRTEDDQTAPARSRPFVRWGAASGPGGRGPVGRSLRDRMPIQSIVHETKIVPGPSLGRRRAL